jgi:2-oxo-4-hydroxy-4-carboxy-5-ureidoimidazoline decarboxylase
MLKVVELNAIEPGEFTRLLAPLFEHSPWVAARTAEKRPFANAAKLYTALCETVVKGSAEEKLSLIRAHPDLVGRAILTPESQAEQAAAGLGEISGDERERFREYNAQYREKFGFPFVICARLNKKEAILDAFPIRLQNSIEKEIETALSEIFKIAQLRLKDLVT